MARLCDRALLRQLQTLNRREHSTTLHILMHLGEVERRKLHLKLGFGSMFEFATRHLGYSESAAGRRIQAARMMRRYPEIIDRFRKKQINLSTISIASRVLNDANKSELLDRIANCSQREVEGIVSTYNPLSRVRDRVRRVTVEVPAVERHDAAASGANRSIGTREPSKHNVGDPTTTSPSRSRQHDRADSKPTLGSAAHSRSGSAVSAPDTKLEDRFVIQFSARPDLMRKIEAARTLLSGRFPRGATFDAVFEAALDVFLEHKSPQQRDARRRQRRQRGARRNRDQPMDAAPNTVPGVIPSIDAGSIGRDAAIVPARSRHIAAAVRDAVYVRDGGRCGYQAANGRRCESTHDLEIDHITPFGRGGVSEADNLRLLCAQHNRLEAERVYGTEWMQSHAARRD